MQNDQETLQFDFSGNPPARPEDLTPGMFLGKDKNYRLEKFLGAGGMGHAWLATEIEDGVELRKVVCKVLPALLQHEQIAMAKVIKTFHLVQPLSHPNICPIYSLKSDPVCGYFFVMGYADGGTLEDWILEHPNYENGLSISQIVEVIRPIAQALDHAHEMGIVHRDVKPQNILFATHRDRKIPWLIDFGISSRIQQTTTQMLSVQGSSGTPAYMAPEQCQNEIQDGRTDQYSLGVLVYQLLSGELPFSAENPIALWGQIVNMPAPPLTNVPPEVNSAVLRALSKNRKHRFASCEEFVDALMGKKPSRMSEWSVWLERSATSASRALKKVMRKKIKWPFAVGVMVLMVIAFYFFFTSGKQPQSVPPIFSEPSIQQVPNDSAVVKDMDFEMDGSTLKKYRGYATHVAIPSVINGQKVSIIGRNAFERCDKLLSVSIPEGVKEIGDAAFKGCSSLTSIEFPESVTSLGKEMFVDCPKLRIHAPEGSKAEEYAKRNGIPFKEPTESTSRDSFEWEGTTLKKYIGKETEVVIPDGTTEIGGMAFNNCRYLTSVVIPDSVEKIGEGAFRDCTALKEWSISSTHPYFKRDGVALLTRDGKTLVACLRTTGEYRIPEGVTEIGWGVFWGCRSLTSVVIPEGMTKIGNYAFRGCSSLTSMVIPESVIVIGAFAFCDCTTLTSVVIPNNVRDVGWGAFAGCTALKEWPISSTHPYFKVDGVGLLTKDGKRMVACLAWATEYRIPEGVANVGMYAFHNCSSLTSVEIPEGVTEIEGYAFFGCRSLTSVVIPESVKEIGTWAFIGCSSLTSVVIPEGVTKFGKDTFSNCPNLTIHAPAGSKAEEYAKQNGIPFQAE